MSLGLRVDDRLDGHTNYNVWKERMQSIFEEAEVWDIMVHTTQTPVVVPTDATQLVAYNKNNKGKRLILDRIKYHCIPHVRGKSNAHEMWTALSNLYQSTNANRKMVLKEKLKNIKMGNDSAVGYLTKITNVRDELAAVGEVIPPSELVWIAVNGLPRLWVNFADGVCAPKPVEQDEDVALVAGGKKGKGKKQASTSSGGGKGKGKGKQVNTQKEYSKVKCWNCQKMGHYAVVCLEKKKKKGKDQSLEASTDIEDFAGVRQYFSELSESDTDVEVVIGDDRVVRAVRVGTLTFQRESKPPLKVAEVLYVPGMRKNLISVSALEDRGYECEIWHRRIGHMYHGALRTLWEITTGMPDFSTDHFDTCRGCAMGKFSKSPFPSSDNKATGILDLIHSDVSGRMSHVSLSGYEYYVLFIDDHARRTWIYFLKTKSEVFKRFQEFRALVETQTGQKIKSLR
eukprot:PITA_13052